MNRPQPGGPERTASRPVLTIGVPTWNRARMLERLLTGMVRGVPGELAGQVEVIVSDNASDDETSAVVASMSVTSDVAIHYYRNAENIGAVRNVLETLGRASGRYWTFLGDDDQVDAEGLVAALSFLGGRDAPPVAVFDSSPSHPDFLSAGTGRLTIEKAAGQLLYYLGNAGRFALDTDLAKKAMSRLPQEGWTSWPQTEVAFVAMSLSEQERPVEIIPIVLASSEDHATSTVYTSYHLAETPLLSLFRLAARVQPWIGPTATGKARRFALRWDRIRPRLRKIVFRKVFSDLPQDVSAFRRSTSRSIRRSEVTQAPALFLLWVVAHTPRLLDVLAMRLYLFMRWPLRSNSVWRRLAEEYPRSERERAAQMAPGSPRAHRPEDLG